MTHKYGSDLEKVYIYEASQLSDMSLYVGANLVLVKDITLESPIDVTDSSFLLNLNAHSITYDGPVDTGVFTGTQISSKASLITLGVIITTKSTHTLFKDFYGHSDRTSILLLDTLRYANLTGNDIIGNLSRFETIQLNNFTIKNLVAGFTIGNIGTFGVIGSNISTFQGNTDEKNLFDIIDDIDTFNTDRLAFQKGETAPGVKPDNEYVFKIASDKYINSGNITTISSGKTKITLFNPAGLQQGELQNVNFYINVASRATTNSISATSPGGALGNDTINVDYLLDIAPYTFKEVLTKKEGVHLVNSTGAVIAEKIIPLKTEFKVSVYATSPGADARLTIVILEAANQYHPVFDGTENEIIVRTNEFDVDDKIYFIDPDGDTEQLPTGITNFELKYVKTFDSATEIMTISNTQGGATLDFGTDAIGSASVAKVENEITFDNTTEEVILDNHGFVEGQAIRLFKLTDATDPLNIYDKTFRTILYVRNPSTNRFQISLEPSPASVLTFDDDGSGTFFLRKIIDTEYITRPISATSSEFVNSISIDLENGLMLEAYFGDHSSPNNAIVIQSVKLKM